LGSFSGLPDVVASFKNKTAKQVREELEAVDAWNFHRPARKRFPRRSTKAWFPNFIWQLDFLETATLASANKNIRYICIIVDSFTRFVRYAFMKNKSANSLV